MKPFFLLLCTAALVTASGSCKKSNSGDDPSKTILGTWELSSVQASIIPTINYPSGNGNLLKFTGSGYQSYTNGQLVKSGTYTVVADSTAQTSTGLNIAAGQFTHRIVYDGDNSGNKVFFQVTDSKLRLISGYFPVDGGSNRIYAKLPTEY
ncbi:MAG TPA: hypothetical protein VLD19_10140 [Chitinophagaceae bacterium]|nr:hypothetical protein [Chitinophagaceae bacterium]